VSRRRRIHNSAYGHRQSRLRARRAEYSRSSTPLACPYHGAYGERAVASGTTPWVACRVADGARSRSRPTERLTHGDVPVYTKRKTTPAPIARPAAVATRTLFDRGHAAKLPGTPTALLLGSYRDSKGKTAEQSLAFFVDRDGMLVEELQPGDLAQTLRPAGEGSILGTALPGRVVSPRSLFVAPPWTSSDAPVATLRALSTAFASLFTSMGVSSDKATWISAHVGKRTTRFALHGAETGQALIVATIATPASLAVLNMAGLGFGLKLLLLAVGAAVVAVVLALIFGSGPVTAAVFAAASIFLKAALFVAAVEVTVLVLDVLLEILVALFPGLTARINAIRGKIQAAQNFKTALQAKQDAGEDVTEDDIDTLRGLVDDTVNEAIRLRGDIDAELPGATGQRRAELQAGRSAVDKALEAMAELKKFADGIR
jgi:hypothetical protein